MDPLKPNVLTGAESILLRVLDRVRLLHAESEAFDQQIDAIEELTRILYDQAEAQPAAERRIRAA